MNELDRYHDLIDYLSLAGARFDVAEVPPRHHWYSGLLERHDGGGSTSAIDAESRVARTLNDDAYVLVVVPSGTIPAERELEGTLGPFAWVGADETLNVTEGLAPGTVPPFGWPYLPGISKVLVDRQIAAADAIVFRAASLNRTVRMTGRDYKGVLGTFEVLNPAAS